MEHRTRTTVGVALRFAAAGVLLLVASRAPASPGAAPELTPSADELRSGELPCTPVHFAILDERRALIASAPTIERARELALQPASAARRALRLASLLAPSMESLAAARARLEDYSTRVERSDTPGAVADEFDRLLHVEPDNSGLIQLADVQVGQAQVRGPGRCHYSTGEIVAIVFGFILFIIPGIILLFLLC